MATMNKILLTWALLIASTVTAAPPQEGKKGDCLTQLQEESRKASTSHSADQPLALGQAVVPVTAHSIILLHLQEIKASGQMYNTIESDDYWRRVFTRADHPELFEEGRDEIARALSAGLESYHRGESLAVDRFADLAIKETENRSLPPLASAPEDLIFKP